MSGRDGEGRGRRPSLPQLGDMPPLSDRGTSLPTASPVGEPRPLGRSVFSGNRSDPSLPSFGSGIAMPQSPFGLAAHPSENPSTIRYARSAYSLLGSAERGRYRSAPNSASVSRRTSFDGSPIFPKMEEDDDSEWPSARPSGQPAGTSHLPARTDDQSFDSLFLPTTGRSASRDRLGPESSTLRRAASQATFPGAAGTPSARSGRVIRRIPSYRELGHMPDLFASRPSILSAGGLPIADSVGSLSFQDRSQLSDSDWVTEDHGLQRYDPGPLPPMPSYRGTNAVDGNYIRPHRRRSERTLPSLRERLMMPDAMGLDPVVLPPSDIPRRRPPVYSPHPAFAAHQPHAAHLAHATHPDPSAHLAHPGHAAHPGGPRHPAHPAVGVPPQAQSSTARSSRAPSGTVHPALAPSMSRAAPVVPPPQQPPAAGPSTQAPSIRTGLTFAEMQQDQNTIYETGPPYACEFCGKDWQRRADRDRHERTHTQERPFKCDLCDKTYARRDALMRHQRSAHGLTEGSDQSGEAGKA